MLDDQARQQEPAGIAALRAEWTKLDAPLRLQGLVQRHLPLKAINATQYDSLKNLPERPARLVQPNDPDPIGSMISVTACSNVLSTWPLVSSLAMEGP